MQNPYSNPSEFPPSSGTSPTGNASNRSPEISFDAIGQAWKLLQPNLGTWIGAFLIYIVISGAISGIQSATLGRDANGVPQIGPTYYLFSLVSFLAAQFFVGGLFRMAISNVRTGRAEIGQMFSAGDAILNLIIAGLLITIATSIGFLMCIVPGLLLSGLFMFVTPLIVDKKQGAIEAIGNSFNALKPQMLMAMLFLIVVVLVGALGALACGVGVLVTAPLALLAVAITYNNFLGGGQSTNQPPMPPSAPIASPFN